MAKLKIGTLLKNALSVLGQHPKLLIVGAIAAIPSLFVGSKMDLSSTLWVIAAILVGTYCIGLIIRYIYESREGQPSWPEMNSFVVGKYFPLLIVYLIFWAIVLFGLVFLIVPGVFFLVRLCLCDYGILLEDDKIFQSIKRSWILTKGNWWRLAVLNAVGLLPFFVTIPFEHLIPRPIFLLASFTAETFSLVWGQAIFILVYLELRKV